MIIIIIRMTSISTKSIMISIIISIICIIIGIISIISITICISSI